MTFAEPSPTSCAGPAARDCKHGRGHDCSDCKVRPFSICGALEPAELDELDRLSQVRSFPARTTLFDQDAPADNVFNLTEGMVRLCKSSRTGAGRFRGLRAAGGFPRPGADGAIWVAAEAVTQVRVCRFARPAFLAYVDGKPHLLRRLPEFAGHELSLAQDQMLLLGRKTAEEKVAAFLLNLQTRYARVGAASVTIPLPISRQDIADYLGLTIETVSRTLTRLAREKVIVIVPDGVRLLMIGRLDQSAAA